MSDYDALFDDLVDFDGMDMDPIFDYTTPDFPGAGNAIFTSNPIVADDTTPNAPTILEPMGATQNMYTTLSQIPQGYALVSIEELTRLQNNQRTPPASRPQTIQPTPIAAAPYQFPTPQAHPFTPIRSSSNTFETQTPRTPKSSGALVPKPAGVTKPRTKKAKPVTQPFTLQGPISVLTQNLDHVPVQDMEAFVNRSSTHRRQEADTAGKVKRPLNYFMLYKMAYQARILAFSSSGAHQLMNVLAGQSWKLETDDIKIYYTRLSAIEKENHMKAFPDYKFTPKRKEKCDADVPE